MNQDDHSLRRRCGAFTVLSAAGAAAVAAAMIPAAPAFADPADDAVAAAGVVTTVPPPPPSPLDAALQHDDASTLLQNDETTLFSNPDLPPGAETTFIDALSANPPVDTAIIEGLNGVAAHGDNTFLIGLGDLAIIAVGGAGGFAGGF
jgi:hypothetical protein